VLLGGRSKRMGRDKAHLDWHGRSWSTRTALLLDRLFEETLLVGGEPEAEAPGRRIADPEGPACALRGLVAALGVASAERVVVLATDLPLVTTDLLLALTAWPEAEVVVPTDACGEHPLCAIYRRDACLEAARENLAAGTLALRELLARLQTDRVPLDAFGVAQPGVDLLTNVNTPDDLAKLEGR
jgi:molybdopterin-guanine dinucleotide biosynthesis protein A